MTTTEQTAPTAERILLAAADLLRTGGIDAVSTRAVAGAAGVQPPTIYRQFGDKDGLLDAVARYVLQRYLDKKRLLSSSEDDPAVELRNLWDLHIEFGMSQPDCYVLTYGQAREGKMMSAAVESIGILTEVIGRLGAQGRLTMSVQRATNYFHSCGIGFVLNQLSMPESGRDPELSSIMRDNALAAISTEGKRGRTRKASELPGRAVALREALPEAQSLPLSAAEQSLLAEWLNRLADHS